MRSEIKKLLYNYEIEKVMIKNLTITINQTHDKELIVKRAVLRLRIEQIDKALDQLTYLQRAIIEKRYFKRHSWAEIADSTGYSMTYVKKQDAMALDKILESL